MYFTLQNYFESAGAQYQFAYKLEGLTDEWQQIGATNYLQFAGLPAGSYILHLKGGNNAGVWGKQELRIPMVGQAFYATPAAYLVYAVLALTIISGAFWFQTNRVYLRNRLKSEQLQQEKLQELNQMKTDFFTNITHELRTPLTLIQGPAERIAAKTDDTQLKRWSATIRQQSRQMLQLINQLLDLNRLEAGREKLDLREANMVLFVRNATFTLQALADQKKITLLFEAAVPALYMPFDGGKLEKVLYNLIANAIKYTPVAGQVAVAVSRVAKVKEEDSDLVEITVQDTGVGISAEHLPFIFDRYYRVPATPNRPEEGTGIGLALVQDLVQLHEGEVTVKSRFGVETTFTVYLPLTRPLAPELPLTEALPATLAYSPEITQLAQMPQVEEMLAVPAEINRPKQLVLIVEDHADMRAYIREILQPFYQVLEADNGVTGLQIARESIPDIIISDIMMPQMDGQTFCILIKQEERTSHIPVILLTAKASPEHRLEGLQTGADVYLIKPFNARELLLHLKNLLTLRQKIIAQFCDNAAAPLTEATDNPTDKTFLERFTAIVMANIWQQQV